MTRSEAEGKRRGSASVGFIQHSCFLTSGVTSAQCGCVVAGYRLLWPGTAHLTDQLAGMNLCGISPRSHSLKGHIIFVAILLFSLYHIK